MVIVEQEPADIRMGLENCCICREKTPYWTQLIERTPGQQVACCQSCARFAMDEEIPTKRAWCGRERILLARRIR